MRGKYKPDKQKTRYLQSITDVTGFTNITIPFLETYLYMDKNNFFANSITNPSK